MMLTYTFFQTTVNIMNIERRRKQFRDSQKKTREKKRQAMYELWQKFERLADLTGNLNMFQEGYEGTPSIEVMSGLLDTLICRLEQQTSDLHGRLAAEAGIEDESGAARPG